MKNIVIGQTYILNGSGDLCMTFEGKKYKGTEVKVLNQCKGGLYMVETYDGKNYTFAKNNLSERIDG